MISYSILFSLELDVYYKGLMVAFEACELSRLSI